jgi:UDP-3-O-[3-hydroxymyristoyl] glucosamine N-acyltransferase
VQLTAGAIAAQIGGRVIGDAARVLRGLASLEDAGPEDLSFLANARYRRFLATTRAGAVLVRDVHRAAAPGMRRAAEGRSEGPSAASPEQPDGGAAAGAPVWIVVADPHGAFVAVARDVARERTAPPLPPGVDPRAVCEGDATGAVVMAFAYVGAGARVGAGSVVMPNAYVGAGAIVGRDCVLGPGSVVMDGCVLGDRVRLAPGAVVGADGFGYLPDPAAAPGTVWSAVPQLGGVRLGDDVEVGANSCVDRAALGETVVGAGSKLDNLVQVGHGARLGPDVAMAACAGVAGSARLGRGVLLGAGAGVLGHLHVGDGAQIGAGSMVARDVPAGDRQSGLPAMDHRAWLREVARRR